MLPRLRIPARFFSAWSTGPVGEVLTSLSTGIPVASASAAAAADMTLRTMDAFPRNEFSKFLVAGAYTNVFEPKVYDAVLSHLHRTDPFATRRDPNMQQTLFDLKLFELMLRCGLIPQCSYDDLSNYTKKYLLCIRGTPLVEAEPASSTVADVLSSLAEIAHSVRSSSIGPFKVHFCQMNQPVTTGRINAEPDLRTLVKHFTAVEIIDQEQNSLQQIRIAALNALRVKAVYVPISDWNNLKGHSQAQQIYLGELLKHSK